MIRLFKNFKLFKIFKKKKIVSFKNLGGERGWRGLLGPQVASLLCALKRWCLNLIQKKLKKDIKNK